MFQRFHEMKERSERGFTLIELLVVILIIAILAAIAIPVFLEQRKKGWVSQVESALKNAATAQESFLTGNDRYAEVGDVAGLEGEGWKKAPDVSLTIVSPASGANSAASYCMQATHTKLTPVATEIWKYDSATGAPEKGTC
jgi:type IV pilus assembly protein PilA